MLLNSQYYIALDKIFFVFCFHSKCIDIFPAYIHKEALGVHWKGLTIALVMSAHFQPKIFSYLSTTAYLVTLRKQAYSNILKSLPSKNEKKKIRRKFLYFFIFLLKT